MEFGKSRVAYGDELVHEKDLDDYPAAASCRSLTLVFDR
jgi:hypothetical protein